MSLSHVVMLHCKALGIYQQCSKSCYLGIKCFPSHRTREAGRKGGRRGGRRKEGKKKGKERKQINLYFTGGETELPQTFECKSENSRAQTCYSIKQLNTNLVHHRWWLCGIWCWVGRVSKMPQCWVLPSPVFKTYLDNKAAYLKVTLENESKNFSITKWIVHYV